MKPLHPKRSKLSRYLGWIGVVAIILIQEHYWGSFSGMSEKMGIRSNTGWDWKDTLIANLGFIFGCIGALVALFVTEALFQLKKTNRVKSTFYLKRVWLGVGECLGEFGATRKERIRRFRYLLVFALIAASLVVYGQIQAGRIQKTYVNLKLMVTLEYHFKPLFDANPSLKGKIADELVAIQTNEAKKAWWKETMERLQAQMPKNTGSNHDQEY